MARQANKSSLTSYLQSSVVTALDNDYADPDYEQRKVAFLLEGAGEDLTTLQTVGSKDGKIDAYRIQQDDGDGHMVLEIWQLSGPDEKAIRSGRVQPPPTNKLKNDLLGLAATLRYGQKSLSEDGIEAVRSVRDKLHKARRAKRDISLRLTVLTLYAVTESTKASLKRLASAELSQLSTEGSTVSVEFLLRSVDDYASSVAGDHHLRPELGTLILQLAADGAAAMFDEAVLAFVKPSSLIEFYRKHRAALLHANARFSLGSKRTTANPQIAESAVDEQKAKRFHELNNGLVITCTHVERVNSASKTTGLRLVNPQVVNGGQTLHTLADVESRKVAAGETCHVSDVVVPVKVVRIAAPRGGQEPDLARAEAIAVASNRQAPLTSRALASYAPVNKKLQQAFARLDPSWFFERTDGEWRAFQDKHLSTAYRAAITGRREASVFVRKTPGQKGSTPRKLVNAELLEALLSAYGCFDEAKPKRVFEESVFPGVLNTMLTDQGWRDFSQREEPSGSFDVFEERFDWQDAKVPPVNLYLLVWLLFGSVGALVLSEARARSWVLSVHNSRNWSKSKFTKYEQWLTWSKDTPRYAAFEWAEHVANAMQKPLVFQHLRMLSDRYGALTEDVCQRILTLPQFNRLAAGEPVKLVLSPEDCRNARIGDPRSPLYTLFQLCRQGCAALFSDHRDEIRGMGTKQQTLLGEAWVARLSRHLDAMSGDMESHSGQFLIGSDLQTKDMTLRLALPDLQGPKGGRSRPGGGRTPAKSASVTQKHDRTQRVRGEKGRSPKKRTGRSGSSAGRPARGKRA